MAHIGRIKISFLFACLFINNCINTDVDSEYSSWELTADEGDYFETTTTITADKLADTGNQSTTSTVSTTTTTSVPSTTPQSLLPLKTSYEWVNDGDQPSQKKIFELDKKYAGITVTVVETVFHNGSYILIKDGSSYNEQSKDRRGFALANNVKKSFMSRFETDKLTLEYVNNGNASTKNRFKVILEPFSDSETTSSASTTTLRPWPTPQPEDSIYLTVNVSGRTLREYTGDVINEMRTCIAQMALDYCANEKIQLTHQVDKDDVIIADIRQCPLTWPQTDTCTQIKFKLPIIYKEDDHFRGYELKFKHLFFMWTGQKDNVCLRDHGFGVYIEPDLDKSFAIWAVVIALVTVLFIVLLWLLKLLTTKLKAVQMRQHRKMSETISSSFRSSVRHSTISMEPHYFQEPPKLFED